MIIFNEIYFQKIININFYCKFPKIKNIHQNG